MVRIAFNLLVFCVISAWVSAPIHAAANSDCATTWITQFNSSDPWYEVLTFSPPQFAFVEDELVLVSISDVTSLQVPSQPLQSFQERLICQNSSSNALPAAEASTPYLTWRCLSNGGGNAFSSMVLNYSTGVFVTQCSQSLDPNTTIFTQSVSPDGSNRWTRSDIETAQMFLLSPQRIVLRNYFSVAERVMVLEFATGATIASIDVDSNFHPSCWDGGFIWVPSPGRSTFGNDSIWYLGCFGNNTALWFVMNSEGAVINTIDLNQAIGPNFQVFDYSLDSSVYFTTPSGICLLAPNATNASCTRCLALGAPMIAAAATGNGLLWTDNYTKYAFINNSAIDSSLAHPSATPSSTIPSDLIDFTPSATCAGFASWCLDLTDFFASVFPKNFFQLTLPTDEMATASWGDKVWILLVSDYTSGVQPSQLILAFDASRGEFLRYRAVNITGVVDLSLNNLCVFNFFPATLDSVVTCSNIMVYVEWDDPQWIAAPSVDVTLDL